MVRSHLSRALLASFVLAGWAGFAEAAPNNSHFQNKKTTPPANKKHVWVTRRHPSDQNKAGDLAAAFQVIDSPLGANELQGVIYLYDKVAGGKYQLRKSYFVTGTPKGGGAAGGVGENSRRRELCIFTGASGDMKITVYASLHKGKDHGNQTHRRVVLRYKESMLPMPEPAKAADCDQLAADPFAPALPAAAPGDCCDEEPDEDVLEEETVPVDPVTENPELAVAP